MSGIGSWLSVRRAAQAALLAFVGWAALALFNQYRVHFPNREHAMIPALQDMQTFCVGRYLIDLPRGSVLYRAISSAGGNASVDFETEWNISRAGFKLLVEERWEAIRKVKVDELGKPFTQPPERIEVMEDAVVFTFNHHATYAKEWPDGSKGTQYFYDTEGYLWRNRTLYRFRDAVSKNEVIEAMRRFQQRSNADIPASEGFCAGEAFFPGVPEDGESTDFAFNLPTNSEVELRIETMGGEPPKQKAIRFKNFEMRYVRDAQRTIGDFAGDEWIQLSTSNEYEDSYESSLYAVWYHPQGESISRQPSLEVRMTLDVDEKAPPPAFSDFPPKKADDDIGKEEFLALWDGILKTLRLRPVRSSGEPATAPVSSRPAAALDTQPPERLAQAAAPSLPLGTSAASLQRCPQTGLWECAAELAAGEKRRHFPQGMTLPTVIVRGPERSLWQKMKGVPPNQLAETTWTLVSYDAPEPEESGRA